jgi:hypothetical protein
VQTITALLEAGASTQSTELLHNIIRGKEPEKKKNRKKPEKKEWRKEKKRSMSPKKRSPSPVKKAVSKKSSFFSMRSDSEEEQEEKVDAMQVDEVNIFDILQKHNYSFSHVNSEGM